MPSNPANGPRQMQTRWPTREKAHGLAGSWAAMIILIQAISGVRNGSRIHTDPQSREHLESQSQPADSDNRSGRTRIPGTSGAARNRLAHTLPARGCGATGPPPSHARASRPGQTTGAVGAADWVATEDKASSSLLLRCDTHAVRQRAHLFVQAIQAPFERANLKAQKSRKRKYLRQAQCVHRSRTNEFRYIGRAAFAATGLDFAIVVVRYPDADHSGFAVGHDCYWILRCAACGFL